MVQIILRVDQQIDMSVVIVNIYSLKESSDIEDMIMKEIELINISEKLDLIFEELRKITACISTKDKGRSSIFIEEKKSHLPTLGA